MDATAAEPLTGLEDAPVETVRDPSHLLQVRACAEMLTPNGLSEASTTAGHGRAR